MPPEQSVPTSPVPETPIVNIAPVTSNTSGMGAAAVVPPEILGWNWGAFGLGWIWGIGNSVWISFLLFVPVFNFIFIFILGAKGNEWAWRNKHWDSIEQFKKVQRTWTKVWLIILAAVIVLWVVLTILLGVVLKPVLNSAFTKVTASYGSDVATNFVQATFTSTSTDLSPYAADGYTPDPIFVDFNKDSRGSFQSVSFNSYSVVNDTSSLSGTVQFTNDSEPVCVVMYQDNNTWKVEKATRTCDSSSRNSNWAQ